MFPLQAIVLTFPREYAILKPTEHPRTGGDQHAQYRDRDQRTDRGQPQHRTVYHFGCRSARTSRGLHSARRDGEKVQPEAVKEKQTKEPKIAFVDYDGLRHCFNIFFL